MIYDGANSHQFTAIRAKAASVSFLPGPGLASLWAILGISSVPCKLSTLQRDDRSLQGIFILPWIYASPDLRMASKSYFYWKMSRSSREAISLNKMIFGNEKVSRKSFSLFIQPIFSLNNTEIWYFPLLILSKKIFQRKENNSRCLCCSLSDEGSSFLVFRDVLTIL